MLPSRLQAARNADASTPSLEPSVRNNFLKLLAVVKLFSARQLKAGLSSKGCDQAAALQNESAFSHEFCKKRTCAHYCQDANKDHKDRSQADLTVKAGEYTTTYLKRQ